MLWRSGRLRAVRLGLEAGARTAPLSHAVGGIELSSVESDPRATERGRNPFELLLSRWKLTAALVLAGLLLGILAAFVQPEKFTAETRVAVGYGNLSSGAIAGFPEAAGDLASNYARYVSDQGVVGMTPSGGSLGGVEVTGSPIPESNVIRIETVSSDMEAATETAERTAEELIETVNNPDGVDSDEVILEDFTVIARELADARNAESAARTNLARLRNSEAPQAAIDRQSQRVADATSARSVMELRRTAMQTRYINATTASETADLQLVDEAQIVETSRSGALQRYGLLGLVVGGVAAVAVAAVLERRSSTGSRPARRNISPKRAAT